MDAELITLLSYLEDEFRNDPSVRVRLRQKSGIRRSLDLEQDYDPESSNLHSARGVQVRVGSRDYFIPAAWATGQGRHELNAVVAEIRSYVESRS